MTLCICILILIAFVAYIVLQARRAAEPQFVMRGVLTGEKLGYMLSSLAFSSKRTARGNGLRVAGMRRRLYAARRAVGDRKAAGKTLQACEQTLFDSFYRIDEALARAKRAQKIFRRLPHVHGVPRLYSFAELLVKSTGGVLTRDTVQRAVRGYCAETPLCFDETQALGEMLSLCLCEYLALYAEKIERMGKWCDRGEEDARRGVLDRANVRRASYVYGYRSQNGSLAAALPDGEEHAKCQSYERTVAAYNAAMSAAVQSLQEMHAFLTDEFVLSLSPVYAQLAENDPSFVTLSVGTERLYLREIADKAKKTHAPEKSIASEALFRAARDNKDISFCILPPPRGKAAQRLYTACTLLFVATLALVWCIFLPRFAWLYALFALPVFGYAVQFMSRIIVKHVVKRRHLPALSPQALAKDKHATVLLFPCYAADPQDIERAFAHLQTVAAANAEPIFSYCLLFDYPKSAAATEEGDEARNASVRAQYEKLGELRDRVCVLVRARTRIAGEETYQGYEKKRGAVLDFCGYVRRGEGNFSLVLGTRPVANYAITLDADTVLCDCISLVCTKAHPYCADTTVLSLRCKATQKRTPFAKLYAGETGPGRYRLRESSVGNDLFGVGNFTGKGIFAIEPFEDALGDLFADNRILSHDYIEGGAAGCLDTDICAAEDVPQTFSDSLTRDIRWLRGDWQLLPYAFPKMKNKAGEKIASPLPPVARHTILANLALSLVPISQMCLLLLALFIGASPAVWVLAFLPQLLRAAFALCALPYAPRQTLYEWVRCVLDVAFLPTVAIYKLCAVCVTLYRLLVRRKLLEWKVFAHAKSNVSLLANAIAAVVFTATTAVFSRSVLFYALSVLFLAGIAACRLLSVTKEEMRPSDALLSRLTDTARQTFAYFAAQEDLYALPCDCYQADNRKGWCARTSPTNIGMALTAYAAAYELGLIEKEKLLSYIERIATTVEKLEKWRGHLYNWYDCSTLQVLPKRFVSTVDSGNFCVALSLASTYVDGTLARRLQSLIDATDFAALFDNGRKLLYIGYDDERKTHTDNHYDLLGSEISLTYLFACAYGKIPKEAFYNLDRHGVRYANATTVYSWTGGAFEYLMTRLFVSPSENTLLHQAMQGATRAQIRYAKRKKSDVFGISECRYSALDACGGNLYRAFGVPFIAHAPLPDAQPYAPYAAFLTQPYCKEKTFVRDLDAFANAGAVGEYGYCESVCDGSVVQSYMTHHQGMLLAACANAVKKDCLPARLQTLPPWRAAQLLCGEEKLTHAHKKKVFPISSESAPIPDEGAYLCKCALLSAVATDRKVRLQYGGIRLLQNLRVAATVRGEKTDLMCGEFSARDCAAWHKNGNGYLSHCELRVLPAPLCAAVTVRYRNTSDKEQRVSFTLSADPVLARVEDYEAHPAYSRLFIRTETQKGRCVRARRKGSGVTAILCVQADDEVRYISDRCTLTGRGRASDAPQNGNPVLAASFSTDVQVGKEYVFTFCYAAAESTEQADYIVRLAADCVRRNMGAAYSLAASVSAYAKRTAYLLTTHALPAAFADGVGRDKPTVAHEITESSLQHLPRVLSDLRLLYEAGFRFHTVLYCRKQKGEYPSLYFDAERLVCQSGIRGIVGTDGVTTVQCDERMFRALANLSHEKPSRRRMRLQRGRLLLASRAACARKALPYSAVQRARDEALLDELLPEIANPLGVGGFTQENAYVLPRAVTPAPWCNIMGNGTFGTVVSESGGGFTFGDNSRQYKLTEWSNDPVDDPASEWISLTLDDETWSVTRRPFGKGVHGAVHGRGYSEFFAAYRGITARLTVFVSRDDDVKFYTLTVRNRTDKRAELTAVCALRAVLGDFRRNTLPSLSVEPCPHGVRLHCEASHCDAYLYSDGDVTPLSADVAADDVAWSDELLRVHDFWGLAAPLDVPPEEERTVRFALSTRQDVDFSDAEDALCKAKLFYERLPHITLDGEYGYLTEWLPYQVYNSRFAARTGFYQVSGAYGFRDQLQDCLALLYCDPALVRAHLLECARHQFKEGDVQHWWHPPAVGVRTHVCDDRLWLVYVTCAYIAHTGDVSVLDETVPFLNDVPISPQDVSVYTAASFSSARASFREHCLRAVTASCDFGENGLVRMRGGDWNDAMDKVGARGEGTSVWCSMFLYCVIERFAPFVRDEQLRERLMQVREQLREAVCKAYGDRRFFRAYTDDGTCLGAEQASACKIDLLTQSWSVLAGIGSDEQKKEALNTAYEVLCDAEHSLIKLFDPPFLSPDGVGYIGSYPAGVRENGGQYTQAAVWYVSALFQNGDIKRANELLAWLSPAHRVRTEADAVRYCVEPYVSAADVYAGEQAGKGGWTWYTGSAAWLYKCLIEQYAGITVHGNVLRFSPRLSNDTPELNVTVLYEGVRIKIKIVNAKQEGEWRVRIGEVFYNTASLQLSRALEGKKIAVVRI